MRRQTCYCTSNNVLVAPLSLSTGPLVDGKMGINIGTRTRDCGGLDSKPDRPTARLSIEKKVPESRQYVLQRIHVAKFDVQNQIVDHWYRTISLPQLRCECKGHRLVA